MANQKSSRSESKNAEQLEPQEQEQLVKSSSQNYSIGIPKESDYDERRVAIVPSAAKFLVDNGCKVLVESQCGLYCNYSDNDYAEIGAIVTEKAEVYKADIILKVTPPSINDIELMKERQILISALHLRVRLKEYFELLSKKKLPHFHMNIYVITLALIPLCNRLAKLPVIVQL
jgi:alanine dehydrogenase